MPVWLSILLIVVAVVVLGTLIWALCRASYRTTRYGVGWFDGFTDALMWWWIFDSFDASTIDFNFDLTFD